MAYKTAKIIDTIRHKSGIEAEIKLDPKTLMFYCSSTVINGRIESKDGDEIRKLVTAALESVAIVEWQPVIEVKYDGKSEVNNGYGQGMKLEISIKRFWISMTTTSKLVCDQWDYMSGDNKDKRLIWARDWVTEVNKLPYHFKSGRDIYSNRSTYSIYPYTVELWRRLEFVQECIKLSNTNLVDALRSENLEALTYALPILPVIPLVKEL